MVHAAALLPAGHGQGTGPALLRARHRHRHPILGLTLAVPRRLDHAHTLRRWVFRFGFKAAPEVPATAASSSRLAGSGACSSAAAPLNSRYLVRPRTRHLGHNRSFPARSQVLTRHAQPVIVSATVPKAEADEVAAVSRVMWQRNKESSLSHT
jgi:hypothetical protein